MQIGFQEVLEIPLLIQILHLMGVSVTILGHLFDRSIYSLPYRLYISTTPTTHFKAKHERLHAHLRFWVTRTAHSHTA